MSILNRVRENKVTLEASIKDSTGASFINSSGLYRTKIESAFVTESENGAIGIFIRYGGDVMHEDTLWLTNRDGDTYYTKGGKDFPMMGYVDAKRLNFLLAGEMVDSITKLETENRLIKHFKLADDLENEGKKKRVEDTIEAEVLTQWIGKEVDILVQMKQKEGWDKDSKKPSGVGAVTKDGEPITEVDIIGYFNQDGQTASEAFKGEEGKALTKGLERIEKTPIRMFKAKGATKPSSSTAPKTPARPRVF